MAQFGGEHGGSYTSNGDGGEEGDSGVAGEEAAGLEAVADVLAARSPTA